MNGTEPLYLRDDMDEAELFAAFNAKNPYYRHIAARFCELAKMLRPGARRFADILPRTGYNTRALGNVESVTLIEHRPAFADYLKTEFQNEPNRRVVRTALAVDDLINFIAGPHGFDVSLVCESIAPFAPKYRALAGAAGRAASERSVFGITMGPSYHRFASWKVADFRNGGVVGEGELMSELSHPVHQAVHRELVRLARERHRYDRADAYPPAENALDFTWLRAMNEKAGFPNTVVFEERFAVPGHLVHQYCQNGWTFYMRFGALAELREKNKPAAIALLKEAIENVRGMPQYEAWCKVAAWHPVGYCFALRG